MITLIILGLLFLASLISLYLLYQWRKDLQEVLPPPDPKTKRPGTESVP